MPTAVSALHVYRGKTSDLLSVVDSRRTKQETRMYVYMCECRVRHNIEQGLSFTFRFMLRKRTPPSDPPPSPCCAVESLEAARGSPGRW